MCEVKNILEGINSRLDISEDKTTEGEDTARATVQNGPQREKGVVKKNEQTISKWWHSFRQPNVHVTRFPKGEGRKVEVKEIFEEITAKNILSVINTINPQIKQLNKSQAQEMCRKLEQGTS